jgi:hypothetical protein
VKNLWSIADLIDLHFFSQLDEEVQRKDGEEALAKRDRIIYLAKIEPKMGKADDIPPRILVRKWLAIRQLQYRRERGREGLLLPGTVWRELAFLCQGLFFFCGLFTGLGLAGSLLLYSGTMPLNVSVYFGLFVAVQIAMLGMQALFLCYRRARRIPMESTVMYVLIGRLLMRGLDGIRRWLQRKMTGHQRLDLAALLGGVRQRQELAALLIWPAFILIQLGSIGFNLGVIGATLAKVAFSDIAFAWQSSLQLSAELVAGLVQWIALPWSWAVSPGYPSLTQIQGSQMVLKEGVSHLATSDLVAWWPFLCLSVLVYGLLPRCLLLALGLVQQRRALEQLHFATLGIRPLLRRMTAPRVDTNGVREIARTEIVRPAVSAPEGATVSPPAQSVLEPVTVAEGALFYLLIPDEIYEDCPQTVLIDLVRPRLEPARFACLRYGVPGMDEMESLAPLRTAVEQGGLAGIVLLQEAWQPPLKETELFLRGLRRLAGERTPLTIFLIGKPSAQTMLTPVDPEQLRIWRQKMTAQGDPWLEVHPLVQP